MTDWIPWALLIPSLAYIAMLLIQRQAMARAIESGRGVKMQLHPIKGVILELEGQQPAHLVPEKPEDKERLHQIVKVAAITGRVAITLPLPILKGKGRWCINQGGGGM